MKLVCITHIRCQEYAAVTYAGAPTEWDVDEIADKADQAQEEYLEAGKVYDRDHPAPQYVSYIQFLDKADPSKTIAQVKEEYNEIRAKEAEFQRKKLKAKQKFAHFLRAQGFTPLYEMDMANVKLDWGHQHGVQIDYSETEEDTQLSPADYFAQAE